MIPSVLNQISTMLYNFIKPIFFSFALMSVWRDLSTLDLMVGDVVLLKKALIHLFDERSLNVYRQTDAAEME